MILILSNIVVSIILAEICFSMYGKNARNKGAKRVHAQGRKGTRKCEKGSKKEVPLTHAPGKKIEKRGVSRLVSDPSCLTILYNKR